jgi:hypothetical protein
MLLSLLYVSMRWLLQVSSPSGSASSLRFVLAETKETL